MDEWYEGSDVYVEDEAESVDVGTPPCDGGSSSLYTTSYKPSSSPPVVVSDWQRNKGEDTYRSP